jgi:protein O-GlcNAc transferase
MLKWIKRKIADKAPDTAAPVADPASQRSRHPQTVKGQGDAHVKAGRYADAERCYRQVPESDTEYPGALVMLGFVLREQGRTDEARQVLERAVRVAAEDADGHYLLGSVLEATGPRDMEISHLQRAIDLRPNFELARHQLIMALFKANRYAEATRLCEESMAILPDSGELHFYRSTLYLHADEKALAAESCKRALALNPGLIAARQSLSRILADMEQLDEAEVSLRREIELTPEQFAPHHNLGTLLNRLGRRAEAIELLERAISLKPNSAASYWNLGAAYTGLDEFSKECLALARGNFEKAIELDPNVAGTHYDLGICHWRDARLDHALASFDRAIELDPGHAKARWARVMMWAPTFSSKDADDARHRSRFGDELAKFEEWRAKSDNDDASFVGEIPPFFLTYQEEDNLALLKQYGRVCTLALQRWLEREKAPPFKRPIERRIRLGIVSADIRLHSIWMALIEGWFLSFDQERFELVVFSLTDPARDDEKTAWARTKSDVFVGGPKTVSQWVAAIREQNCEILLYPAVGLHPMTSKLAGLRLVPVQINTWGHPDTSGLPTLDYYVSADCFEPADAQDHYSERLVLLPHLGNRLLPPKIPNNDPDFLELNIDLEKPILVCPGTPFKYQAAHDHVFTDIARSAPEVQLVFFRPKGASQVDLLQARITQAFEAAGLNVMDHVRFIDWLEFPEFHGLLRQADVMLDTIGFSGYNTAVQAMECGLPLVTREGRFLRGRLASGVLRRMGLQELIVQTKTDYVNLVVRLATDHDYQVHIRHEIERRRPVLFDDQSAMGPFQDFLESVARPVSPRTD